MRLIILLLLAALIYGCAPNLRAGCLALCSSDAHSLQPAATPTPRENL